MLFPLMTLEFHNCFIAWLMHAWSTHSRKQAFQQVQEKSVSFSGAPAGSQIASLVSFQTIHKRAFRRVAVLSRPSEAPYSSSCLSSFPSIYCVITNFLINISVKIVFLTLGSTFQRGQFHCHFQPRASGPRLKVAGIDQVERTPEGQTMVFWPKKHFGCERNALSLQSYLRSVKKKAIVTEKFFSE